MRKKIILEPEFKRKIPTDEKVYYIIKEHGPITLKEVGIKSGLMSGGNITNAARKLVTNGHVICRKCECGMHDIYQVPQ